MKSQSAIGLALTWDGARWPLRSLPAAARAFLRGKVAPGSAEMEQLLSGDQVKELRICWVPRLKGGDEVLNAPFHTADGLRMNFRATASRQFGDVLGVVYRR